MVKISIAMPVFNGEAYLAEALTCIENQSFRDYEVIILDNCSTDSTRTIADAIVARDPRFRLVEQTSNKGAMPNFLDGLRSASGEYFLWRAFDDLSDPNYLDTLAQALDENPDAALATGTIRMVNMDGSNERIIGFPTLNGRWTADMWKLLFGSHAGWFYGLWRRQALEEPFEQIMRACPHTWGNDHLALLPFLFQQRIVYAPGATFHQRLKKRATTAKKPNPVSLAAMRKMRSEFSSGYKMILSQYGPPRSWKRLFLRLILPLYREKRTYRMEQLVKALFRPRR